MAIQTGARPATLDGCWQKWLETDVDNVVRTEAESGHLKTRRRFTGTARTVTASVTLPASLYNDFMTWWRVNQKQGAIATRVITPAGTEEIFQWVAPPQVNWIDARAFTATVEMFQGELDVMPIANVVNSPMLDDALFWLLTFEDFAHNVQLRAVNNLEDVVSRGQTYTAFPFSLTLPPDDGQKPQSVELTFANVGRELMDLVRKHDISQRPSVKLELVLASAPDVVEKTIDFMVVANATYNANDVTFELSSSSIFARKTMTRKYTQAEFPSLFWALQ